MGKIEREDYRSCEGDELAAEALGDENRAE